MTQNSDEKSESPTDHVHSPDQLTDQKVSSDGQKSSTEKKEFVAINGCCKDCMKSFSASGKACICQVPMRERRTHLEHCGCKICGCQGCNPQDRRKEQRRRMKEEL